jgi:predicted nuclease with TOPRIM domain
MWWLRVAVVLVAASLARAQDPPNADELSRKYQDALEQLKSAQDRKNELATENEQLRARIAELESQLEDHKRAAAEYAQQTFFLRSHYAAWQSFVQRYPRLASQWRAFMQGDVLGAPADLPEFVDPSLGYSSTRWPSGHESK